MLALRVRLVVSYGLSGQVFEKNKLQCGAEHNICGRTVKSLVMLNIKIFTVLENESFSCRRDFRVSASNHCITRMLAANYMTSLELNSAVKYIPFLLLVPVERWRKMTPSCSLDTYRANNGDPMINVWGEKIKKQHLRNENIYCSSSLVFHNTNPTLIRMPSMKSHSLTVPSAEQE